MAERTVAKGRWGRHRRLLGDRHPGLSPLVFWILSIVLGIVAGFGAYGFRALIALVHNAVFLGKPSIHYNANVHTAAPPWLWAVVFVPVIGALLVVFLIKTFAPEAKGHGVPEVMDAIYYNKSEIRPVVAVIKSLGSALSIGTGGSVGREGPIVQIGAAFGSWSGKLSHVCRWQRATMIAAGGGAGIAATFNTPIGGVLFAVELLLHEISVRTLVPVALATTTSTYVARVLFGDARAFPVPEITTSASHAALPAYLVLGAVTALASALFIRALYGTEDVFEKVFRKHPYLGHATGMFAVGLSFTILFALTGHYYIQGVGYATIVDILTSPQGIAFLALLAVLKLAVTSLTLGSGASGGVFSPSLFMGASIGGAFGVIAGSLGLGNPMVFALAGMAGMVAGTTGAVLTPIVMLFEMTLDYSVVLPLALTATVSYGVRRLLIVDNIYTMKLSRRGHVMPQALQANAHMVHHVSDIALSPARIVPADVRAEDLPLDQQDGAEQFVIVDGDEIAGVIGREWALAHRAELDRARCLGQLALQRHVTIAADDTIFELLSRIQRARASVAVVVERDWQAASSRSPILGVVTKAHLAEAIAEGMELFED